MKRPLTIAVTAALTILFVYACGSTIRTANTSLVTITIGGSQGSATLHAEAATAWVRFKHFLADAKLMPEAYAYIPSVVQSIVVTVTASDMTMPIVGVSNLSSNQTTARVQIEVPNGKLRKFTIEGIHGATGATTYGASTEMDLNGTEITLPITMQFNYFGRAIFVDPVNGNDLSTGLTYTRPLKTITTALSLQSTSARYTTIPVIWVEQGDYVQGASGVGEAFPLQLNPGTALICGGRGYTSVIGGGVSPGTTIMRGNAGASIDNCKIVVTQESGVGVTDVISGQTPTAVNMKINGSLVELSNGGTSLGVTGVRFFGDSTLLESRITGSALQAPSNTGVLISGGRPSIISSTISNITGVIAGIGINVTANARPTISGNIIEKNAKGIAIPSGDGDISGNTIRSNTVSGVDISTGGTGTATGNPKVNGNSIFCNGTDVNVVSGSVIDLRNNAWDHDASTNPPGPVVNRGFIDGGYDIIYSSSTPVPTYVPFSTAASGGCVSMADTIPPVFSGLSLVSNVTYTSMLLSWTAATDNVTPSANIVYLIYQAATSGGENYGSPTYTTAAGAANFIVTDLIPGTTYYFVVRAKDEAGNIDGNTVERSQAQLGLNVAMTGNDTTGDGSSANPFRTITKALSATTGSQNIFVSQGTYSAVVGGGPGSESFPLQLKSGTVLYCTGTNHSTVINDAGSTATGCSVIVGAQGAVVEGCTVDSLTPVCQTAVSDGGFSMTISNTNLISYGMIGMRYYGVTFSGNSTLKGSLVKDFALGDGVGVGVVISGGNVLVTGSTITGNENGMRVSAGSATVSGNTIVGSMGNGISLQGGTAVISGNQILSNPTGISAQGGTALVSGNQVEFNTTGVSVFYTSPTISGNTIRNNASGVSVVGTAGTSPVVNSNSIYCNTNFDLDASGASDPFNATNNTWDHAPPTAASSATTACAIGTDICYFSSAPVFLPYKTAAPDACSP